jgi:hypothetical protein
MSQLAHFYYSGTEVADVDASWWEHSKSLFCTKCHRLRFPFQPIDVELATPAPKRADMFMANHSLLPLVLSERMIEAMANLHAHLHIGRVFFAQSGTRRPLPFFTCTSRRNPVPLHGRNPSIINGRPVPESDRVFNCEDCGIESRRERSPWFLSKSSCPAEPTFCTDLGLVVPEETGARLRALGLRQVRVESVDVVDR